MQHQNQRREPSHAGSWYTNKKSELDNELNGYLAKTQVTLQDIQQVKAIIGPHAGLYYSGPTAAWCYQYLKPQKDLRVFLLGPCHHVYMKGCAVSNLKTFGTPLGDIQLDLDTIQELKKEGLFQTLKKTDEEDEHSLELHLPFIQKMLGQYPFKLVPIMVGNTSQSDQIAYGKILAKYFDDKNTIFIISSDFCHWGANFQYFYQNKQDGEVFEQIEKLDKAGMSIIEQHNSKQFNEYLKQTQNTICGQNPISVLLSIIENSSLHPQLKTKFISYAQSNKARAKVDSSVSYAAGVTYI